MNARLLRLRLRDRDVLQPGAPPGEALDVALDSVADGFYEGTVVEDQQRRVVEQHPVDLPCQVSPLLAAERCVAAQLVEQLVERLLVVVAVTLRAVGRLRVALRPEVKIGVREERRGGK